MAHFADVPFVEPVKGLYKNNLPTHTMLQTDWNATISLLRQTLPQAQFINWVKPVEFIRCQERTVVLGVPSRFHEEWVRDNYSSHISRALKNQCGSELQLEFEILESSDSSSRRQPVELRLPQKSNTAKDQPKIGCALEAIDRAVKPVEPPQLPLFNHPFFNVGANDVAIQCAEMFIDGKDLQLNPLVLQADVGLGKTHLLTEIGCRLHQKDSGLRIRFTTAESFTSEMTRHIQANDLLAFKRKYSEQTDCLLFDNVHELRRRPKTQETLLHIFNDITARRGHIAFTTSVSPNRLEDFGDPLRSRLLSGMLAEIRFPSHEDRVSLLAQMADHNGICVEPVVLRTLAAKTNKDVRELVGALLRAHLQAKLQDQPLDIEFFSKSEFEPTLAFQSVSIEEIVSLVEHSFGIGRSQLISKSRKGAVVWARQVGMYLARMYTALPLEEIGRALGRDHATVIHSFQKVSEVLESKPTKRYQVEYLKQKLEARIPQH